MECATQWEVFSINDFSHQQNGMIILSVSVYLRLDVLLFSVFRRRWNFSVLTIKVLTYTSNDITPFYKSSVYDVNKIISNPVKTCGTL